MAPQCYKNNCFAFRFTCENRMEKHVNELEKALSFERSEWPVLRMGWALMGLFLFAGVLGVFGTGIFSRSKLTSGTFTINYDKYLRYSVSSEIEIETKGLGPDSSLWINSDYMERIKITEIFPQPKLIDQQKGQTQFKFSSRSPTEITLYIEPVEGGKQILSLRLNGTNKTVSQYIFY